MKSFRQYIVEFVHRNTHIQHLEDLVFSGIESAQVALQALISLKRVLLLGEGGLQLSVKWDGSPSIVCGPDPISRKFFIGTKGVFNKTPKVCYSHDDIELQFAEQENLVKKLKLCFDSLSEIGLVEILQGDLLFTSDSLVHEKIGEYGYVTFTPNTITYAVPEDSFIAEKIARASVGVAFHTTYSGDSFANLTASVGANISLYLNKPDVWLVDSKYDVDGSAEIVTQADRHYIDGRLSDISLAISELDPGFCDKVVGNSNFINALKMYVNSKVRQGVSVGAEHAYFPELHEFLLNRVGAFATDIVTSHVQDLSKMFHVSSLISELKLFFLMKLTHTGGVSTFIRTSDGFRTTSPEGFVAADQLGNVVKLVNRLEFSRENFLKNT